ncbi:MAG: sigma-54 dependent transcriptional regulator [Candidatus Brocadiaceae bacterium]|jgi:DNA-binding NtrC family response regulator
MAKKDKNEKLRVCVVAPKSVTESMPSRIKGREVEAVRCTDDEELLQAIAEDVPDAVLMDVKHATGEDSLLDQVLRRYHNLPVIVEGKNPDIDTVIECIKKRAEDFVPRGDLEEKLPEKLLRAAEDHRLMVEVNQLMQVYEKGGGRLGEMVGISPVMCDVYDTIKSICNTDATVLVWGPSGTGKELAAKAIHTLGPRNSGKFVTVNCAAIPKDLLESELFGHEKGAFTGADRQRIGCCERADKGTLFLDEIGEMDLGLQSKLLRFLQNHIFTRVGATEDIEVDTRVIAATNKDPLEEIEKGSLREDLYYRLNVVPIYLPPLDERKEDIPVLAEHFLRMMCEKYYKYFYDFSPDAVRLMLGYSWPGNVRELRNTIERIVVLATTDRVTPDLFPARIREAAADADVADLEVEQALEHIKNSLHAPEGEPGGEEDVLPFVEVEKRAILAAVSKCNGDISKAARKLGLSRATLYRKLDKYGVR